MNAKGARSSDVTPATATLSLSRPMFGRVEHADECPAASAHDRVDAPSSSRRRASRTSSLPVPLDLPASQLRERHWRWAVRVRIADRIEPRRLRGSGRDRLLCNRFALFPFRGDGDPRRVRARPVDPEEPRHLPGSVSTDLHAGGGTAAGPAAHVLEDRGGEDPIRWNSSHRMMRSSMWLRTPTGPTRPEPW